jgi:tripeptide aminopeptidase
VNRTQSSQPVIDRQKGKYLIRLPRVIFSLFFVTALGSAQSPSELINDPTVKAALAAAKQNEPETLNIESSVCEIPAPPFKEAVRAIELQRRFQELGLKDVRIDSVGNVLGVRPGKSAHPSIVLAAHLDTVFPEGTNVKTSREGTVMKGPGIGDDCRGLATMLSTIRALKEANLETPGTITFVADVGEEGLGDLRGTKYLFQNSLKGQIDKFISIDGLGESIEAIGVGSMRYRVTFKGPGGHSFGSFGMANPIHAMGRAIAKIDTIEVPQQPKTTFNVGRVNGGTSVNAIAYECWMEVDMRSFDHAALMSVNDRFQSAVHEAVEEENKRWNNRNPVSASVDLVGLRPAGSTPESSAILQTALAVSKTLNLDSRVREGSSDSNVPMSLGIPAITVGGGGTGSGGHSLLEKFDSTDSWKGTQRIVLLTISMAR